MAADVLTHMIRTGQVKNIVRHGLPIGPYRKILWEYLLGLPQDRTDLRQLLASGEELAQSDSFPWLRDIDHLVDETSKKAGRQVLGALLAWNSHLSRWLDLPHLIFPFIKYYGLAEVETSLFVAMTVVWNFFNCGMSSFSPDPPYHALAAVEKLLQHYEPSMIRRFKELDVNAVHYAWPVLRSGFATVFSEGSWVKLWDNVFAAGESGLVVCLVASWVICSKPEMMMLSTAGEIAEYAQRIHPDTDLFVVIDKAHKMLESAPDDVHPRAVIPEKFRALKNFQNEKIVFEP